MKKLLIVLTLCFLGSNILFSQGIVIYKNTFDGDAGSSPKATTPEINTITCFQEKASAEITRDGSAKLQQAGNIGYYRGSVTFPSYPEYYTDTIQILAESLKYFPRLKLSNIFSDGVVLQREKTVRIWGVAKPEETVELVVKGQTKTTTPDDTGNWIIELDPEPAGGPYTLMVSGIISDPVVLNDVYFGDVWLLTGQSNMFQTVVGQYRNFPDYYESVPNETDDFDDIRFAIVDAIEQHDEPASDVSMLMPWNRWEADALGQMSIVGYFFAHSIRSALAANEIADVPLGFIKVCKGGTAVEQWISEEALAAMNEELVPRKGKIPSGYYNGMMAPIRKFAAKGVLWYQGEGNTSNVQQYPLLFETLVNSWREEKQDPVLPFYYVQLAPYRKYTEVPTESDWALMRKAQTECLSIPNTGMACIIDAGHQGNIHPPFKNWVGERLARIALNKSYGFSNEFRGPTVAECQVKGSDVTITFEHVADGLRTQAVDSQPDAEEIALGFPGVSVTADELAGFSLCGEDGIYYRATKATITGLNQLLISNPIDVPEPRSVQYAWQDFPRCNLYNSEGLPAEPFRKQLFNEN